MIENSKLKVGDTFWYLQYDWYRDYFYPDFNEWKRTRLQRVAMEHGLVFSTEKECQAEADIRNKTLKNLVTE